MSENDLQERLRESAKAFDGLLSLIPAQIYYGEGTNEQWKRKKQSKAEKKAAKLGKLDPDSEKNRTAKEVLEERARNKRKLREIEEADVEPSADDDEAGDDDSFQLDGIEMEQPLKRQRTAEVEEEDEQGEAVAEVAVDDQPEESKPLSELSAKEQKKLLKKQKKLEKKASKGKLTEEDATANQTEPPPVPQQNPENVEQSHEPRSSTEVDDDKASSDSEMAHIDLPGLAAKEDDGPSQATSVSSQADSPVFDSDQLNKDSVEPASAATSIASAVPPSEKPKHAKLPSSSSDAFKARLAARIEELRKARKADGVDGKPALTRQELIESRRQKQAQRKAHKKEVRRLAKEEEDRKREEALASARTSPGSFMSPLHATGDADDSNANNFAFGRIAFADGAQMSHDLSYVKEDKGKKKGPSDPKTALAKLEAQKRRVAGLDDDKRKEVLEKETWLAARRRAEGEKIRDDEAMLKKAVKRKEQAKKKSEREWSERKAGVEKAMHERQKKREDNLRKRREEKMLGKAGKKKKGVATKGGRKARPGFEGVGLGGSGGGRRK